LVLFFRIFSPCEIVARCQRFEETYFLHLQFWRRRCHVLSKSWYKCTSPYGAKPQNITSPPGKPQISTFILLVGSLLLNVIYFSGTNFHIVLVNFLCNLQTAINRIPFCSDNQALTFNK
jgi:hypothetical protein